jgi:hypothetical protein
MFLSRIFGRREARSIRRPVSRRRPRVETLEGRQLQSGIVGNHIGVTADIVGNHIGTSAIERKHVVVSPDIVGAHIG